MFADLGALMRRREFLAVIASAAAISRQALAETVAVRTVGLLNSSSAEASRQYLTAFEDGLAETGFARGRNVRFEYRFADNRLDNLATLAAELVTGRADVIFAGGNTPAVQAAKATTNSIPIVFVMGADPIRTGIVKSFARPGGNVTGITGLAGELFSKRLQLLMELVPEAKRIGYLVNFANPAFTTDALKANTDAANRLGLHLVIVNATTREEVDGAFASLALEKADALLLGAETLFNALRDEIVALARRYALPTSYPTREFAEAGGLSSYSTDYLQVYRQCGIYVGRVLKGEPPGDLPVQQPTRFELTINLKSARDIGLQLSPALLARADMVID